ncbi:MAG TPA: 2-oxo-4-hydroxy-4-carboxy-5-ureidoimidazoline decarboxylase [Casimicrobiaceae bacterium]|nr:2-oxo-4-hydroxy-4-carboxy-5-ureidoimidazoline decarboxylase [Casimicrobiaceae bacterium]
MTLARLNALDRAAFVAALGSVFEHSPWVAERAHAARPFAGVDELHRAMVAAMQGATRDEQLALIRAHPELAGRAMVRRELTVDSTNEQAGAGLTQCSPDEYATLVDLNARYVAKFGFPFILAVKGYDRKGVIAEFARRVERDADAEFAEALAQIGRIARFRLEALLAA